MRTASIVKRLVYKNKKGIIDIPVMRSFGGKIMGGVPGNYIDDNEFLPDRIIQE